MSSIFGGQFFGPMGIAGSSRQNSQVSQETVAVATVAAVVAGAAVVSLAAAVGAPEQAVVSPATPKPSAKPRPPSTPKPTARMMPLHALDRPKSVALDVRENFEEVEVIAQSDRTIDAFDYLQPKCMDTEPFVVAIDGKPMDCAITTNFVKDAWVRDCEIIFINGKSVAALKAEGISTPEALLEHLASSFPAHLTSIQKRDLLQNITKTLTQSMVLAGSRVYSTKCAETQDGLLVYANNEMENRHIEATIDNQTIAVRTFCSGKFTNVTAMQEAAMSSENGIADFDPENKPSVDCSFRYSYTFSGVDGNLTETRLVGTPPVLPEDSDSSSPASSSPGSDSPAAEGREVSGSGSKSPLQRFHKGLTSGLSGLFSPRSKK